MITIGALFLNLFLLSQFADRIHAHMYLFSVDGSQDCVRPHPDPKMNPIMSLTDKQVMCNSVGNNSPAKRNCGIKAGSTVQFQFYHLGPSQYDQILHPSHSGPCSVYLSKTDNQGRPTGWFKIFEQGYNSQDKKWCTEYLMRQNWKDGQRGNGKLSVMIPSGLEDGRYVVRTEIVALHGVLSGGVELYVNCGDINISGGSGSLRPSTVQIPSTQWATPDSPGMKFDIFKSNNSTYVVPGPPVLASSETYKSSPNYGRTEESAKPINSEPNYGVGNSDTSPGEKFPLCKGNHVKVIGSDGKRWGWEDNKSCIMPKNRDIIGLSTPRCRARIGRAK